MGRPVLTDNQKSPQAPVAPKHDAWLTIRGATRQRRAPASDNQYYHLSGMHDSISGKYRSFGSLTLLLRLMMKNKLQFPKNGVK